MVPRYFRGMEGLEDERTQAFRAADLSSFRGAEWELRLRKTQLRSQQNAGIPPIRLRSGQALRSE
jgi:hypothetical protein